MNQQEAMGLLKLIAQLAIVIQTPPTVEKAEENGQAKEKVKVSG